MIKEVIVVEGLHDRQKLERIYPGIRTIVTGGSAISEETLRLISIQAKETGVILFLDPDHPGRKLQDEIQSVLSPESVRIAFLDQKKAKSKDGKKVGVEHAKEEDIRAALDNLIHFLPEIKQGTLTMSDLYLLGLCGKPGSEEFRANASKTLNFPVSNAKTFLKYCNRTGMTLTNLEQVIR